MPGHGETIFGLTTPDVTLRSRSRQQVDEPYPPIWMATWSSAWLLMPRPKG